MRAADGLVRPTAPAEPEADAAAADPRMHAGGACRSWRGLARVVGAETLGTALLVALAPPPGPLAAPAAGLVVALVLQCLGPVSGAQVNPVVSLMAWWCGRMRAGRLAAELAAQLVGGLAGAAAHAALAPRPAAALVTRLAPTYPAREAVCVEALCALCLALGSSAQWRWGGATDTWPLRAGALVAALAVFAADSTGGVANPARSFGPALLAADWDRHWVYWAGPLAGAAAACAVQTALFPAPAPAAPRRDPRPKRMAPREARPEGEREEP